MTCLVHIRVQQSSQTFPNKVDHLDGLKWIKQLWWKWDIRQCLLCKTKVRKHCKHFGNNSALTCILPLIKSLIQNPDSWTPTLCECRQAAWTPTPPEWAACQENSFEREFFGHDRRSEAGEDRGRTLLWDIRDGEDKSKDVDALLQYSPRLLAVLNVSAMSPWVWSEDRDRQTNIIMHWQTEQGQYQGSICPREKTEWQTERQTHLDHTCQTQARSVIISG